MIPKHFHQFMVWKKRIVREGLRGRRALARGRLSSRGTLLNRIAFLWILAALSMIPAVTEAAPAPQAATSQVKAVMDDAMNIQTRPDLEGEAHRRERARLIRKLIADNFLAGDMARESLKGHWDRISTKQRTEFQRLFTVLFQDSYTRLVLNFLKKETVEYRGESTVEKDTVVRTVIMRANEHIPVDYHMVQKSGRWFIRDVDIDGVSIVQNYRNKFRQVIEKTSVDGLLQNMKLQSQATEQ